MPRVESAMLPLQTAAPEFELPDVISGKTFSVQELRGKDGILVMFICRHCPFVKHLERGLAQLGRDYAKHPIGIVAISSNDVEMYPEDAPASLKQQAKEIGFSFPYLYDETQEVAQAFDATCTPDFFLFDKSHRLVYRGQFDDSRPGNGIAVTGEDLRRAIDAVLQGTPVSADQRPSLGCSIKWKKGAPAISGKAAS
jgi:thiol-disulfide isomerase/thioredoxin